VTFHMGMLPASPARPDDSAYRRIRRAVEEVGDYAARRSVTIGLETGQETAAGLLAFLDRLSAPVGVNFDGGNFVAYQTGDPVEALRELYPRTVGVHLKDRLPPPAAGRIGLGERLGQGTARVDDTLRLLLRLGWSRPIILETYAVQGDDPIETLTHARDYVLDRLRSGAAGRAAPA
jgi:sugar phosphate isomerase/epimerase